MPISLTITDPDSLTDSQKEVIAKFIGLSQSYLGLIGGNVSQATHTEEVNTQRESPEPILATPPSPEPILATPPAPAPILATPPAPAGIQVDSSGSPWDSRIHSASRATVSDGTWRQRRNLDPEVLASVQAELRAVMGAPAPIPKPPTVPSVAPPAPPVSFIPPPPQVGAVPTASTSDKGIYLRFIKAVTAQVAAVPPQLTAAQVAAACQTVDLPGPLELMHRTDLIPAVAEQLGLAL